MKAKIITYIAAFVLTVSACEHNEGHREGTIDLPEGNDRPPVEENRQFDVELDDNVWRLSGAGMNLRYDCGGVMFVKEKSNMYRIIDLDGATEISFSYTGLRPDSTLVDPVLDVNGVTAELTEAKMMGLDGTSGWYRLLSADDVVRVLVVPEK